MDELDDAAHEVSPAAAGLSDAVRERLAEEHNVWLCTVRANGSAHVTPVWFVYEDARWWISVEHNSVKVRNVWAEPRVSLALEDGTSPVVAEGRASVISEGIPAAVLAAFERKYGWDITVPDRPDEVRVLLEVRVRRWLLAGTAR